MSATVQSVRLKLYAIVIDGVQMHLDAKQLRCAARAWKFERSKDCDAFDERGWVLRRRRGGRYIGVIYG